MITSILICVFSISATSAGMKREVSLSQKQEVRVLKLQAADFTPDELTDEGNQTAKPSILASYLKQVCESKFRTKPDLYWIQKRTEKI